MTMGLGGCQGSDCEGCCGNSHSRAKKERENTEVAMEKSTDFIFYHLLIPKTKQLATVVSACPEKEKEYKTCFNWTQQICQNQVGPVYTGQYAPVQPVFRILVILFMVSYVSKQQTINCS